ncbi:MAG: AraC family transcriptional regulator [Chitinophagales bacterium]|nr:helix-turn-helix domain-containing protein [Chitinophagales bacterium]MDW8273462.1 AraC family transcriptional regulator [Chitinophagales bacterium]
MSEGILYIGVSQCLFAAFIILVRSRKATHEKILIGWLLFMALKFLVLLLKNYHEEYFDAQFATGLIPFTFGPFMYLYTRFLTDEDARFRWIDLKHFLPFIISTVFYFAYCRDRVSFEESTYLKNDEYLWVRALFAVAMVGSIILYSALTSMQIRYFFKTFRQKFSFESGKSRINWLRFVNITFIISNAVFVIAGGWNAIAAQKIFNLDLLSGIWLIVLAYAVSYHGVQEKGLFYASMKRKEELITDEIKENNIPETAELKMILEENHILASEELEVNVEDKEINSDETTEELRVAKKPLVSETQMQRVIVKLLDFMEKEKPYLNPELTIQDLADKMNIPKHHLTYIINNGLQKNFFNFVNEYRVEEFKKRVANPAYKHLTLLAIAFDSGFNSKSSFNNIFKNITGQTPSEYKKSIDQKK